MAPPRARARTPAEPPDYGQRASCEEASFGSLGSSVRSMNGLLGPLGRRAVWVRGAGLRDQGAGLLVLGGEPCRACEGRKVGSVVV